MDPKLYMEWLGKVLGFKEVADWYKITWRDIETRRGGALLKRYGNSPSKLLHAAYPQHSWLIWRFEKVPRRFWEEKENCRKFLDWLGKDLGFSELEDWYGIKLKDIVDRGGQSLFEKYSNFYELLCDLFPEHRWLSWRFKRTPKGYSCGPRDKEENQNFVDYLSKKLLIKDLGDWYRVSHQDIVRLVPIGISQFPLKQILPQIYLSHNWDVTKLQFGRGNIMKSQMKLEVRGEQPNEFHSRDELWTFKRTVGYWDILENQKKFVSWLGRVMDYHEIEDWYKIKCKDIIDRGGSGLLSKYGNSPSKLLMKVFPDHHWIPWKLEMAPYGHWTKMENQVQFMEWLRKDLGFEDMEDWYRIRVKDITQRGGRRLLDVNGISPSKLLAKIYPDHDWLLWRFEVVPRGFWNDKKNQKEFFQRLNRNRDSKDQLSQKDIIENGGVTLLSKYRTLSSIRSLSVQQ